MAKSKQIISTTEILNRAQIEIICGLLRLIPWENRTIVINKMHYFLNPDSDLPDGFLVKSVTLTEDGHYVEATIQKVDYDYLDQTIHDVTEVDENTNTCFLLDETETMRLEPIDNSWAFQNLALLKLIYDEAEKKLNDDSAVITAKKVQNVTTEPLQKHTRNPRGTGRKPVAAIMVSQEVKDMFDCWKDAYSERFGKPVTAEQIMRRWMDGIGTAFDATTAKEVWKHYRAPAAEKGSQDDHSGKKVDSLFTHTRNPRGAGRKPVAAIMVPQEVKDMFGCWKNAYSERFGKPVTAEQIMRRWMDGIGTAFDATTAKEARKRYHALAAEKGSRDDYSGREVDSLFTDSPDTPSLSRKRENTEEL